MLRWRWLCLPLVAIAAGSAAAENTKALTLARVVELAHTRSPEARVARARAQETRSGLVGARAWSTENPSVEGLVGPRFGGETSTDVDLALSWPLDLAGTRGKRVGVVEAEVARDDFVAADNERLAAGAAVAYFYGVLSTQRRLALAEEWLALAEELRRTAVERERAGDTARFDVNLAEAEVGRAASTVAAEKGRLARARAALARAIGLSTAETQAVQGDLGERQLFDHVGGEVDARNRPDLRAAKAEADVARADRSLAGAHRLPTIDLRVSYAHEVDADILLGGVAIHLPLFERGQGAVARADARAARAEVELDTQLNAANADIAGAREAYALAVEAVRVLEEQALPKAVQNEALAREAYRAGKIDLAALLLIRRDALDTRREHLERLLEAALAGVDLWVAVGAPSPNP